MPQRGLYRFAFSPPRSYVGLGVMTKGEGRAHSGDDSKVRKSIFTIVRLTNGATVERACELAGIAPSEVTLTQKVGEKTPEDLPENFRIISFDGLQITISEKVD